MAGKDLEAAEAAIAEGRIGDAAQLAKKAHEHQTKHTERAASLLLSLVDSAGFTGAELPQTIEAIKVLKRHGATKPLVFEVVWPLVGENIESDPVTSLKLLDSVASLGGDAAMLAHTRISILESLVTRVPEDQSYAVELALFYESEGRFDELETLLAPHTETLGTTEGARILGQQYAAENKIQASYDLIVPYTTAKLKSFHQAEKRYSAALVQVWDATLKYLNDGDKFYQDYDQASEAEQQQMVDDEYAKRRDRSPPVATALKNYQKAADIVPVALDMGLIMLRRAQNLSDADERQQELERAEETFLSIRDVAGESDEYRLYLAQVYYWLGRENEGKALLDELLEASGGAFDTVYSVASVLRDLGASSESQALMQESYDGATLDEDKYAAADLLSRLAYDLDERIEWLKLSDPNTPRILADLNNLLGLQAEYAQNFTQAEKYYRLAAAAYEEKTVSSTTRNDLALIYFSLYRVGRDNAILEKGVASMDEAIALEPSNSIILINAASELAIAACEDLVGDSFSLEKLKTRGHFGLLRYLYDNETEKRALGERLRNHPGIQKAITYLQKVLILAPKKPTPYTELAGLYSFLYDLE